MPTLRRVAAILALAASLPAFADGITYECSKFPDSDFKVVASLWIDGDDLTCSITDDTKFRFRQKWLEDGHMLRIYSTKEAGNIEIATTKAGEKFPGALIVVLRNTATGRSDSQYFCAPRGAEAK